MSMPFSAAMTVRCPGSGGHYVGQCAGLGELGAGANEGLEARRLGDQ